MKRVYAFLLVVFLILTGHLVSSSVMLNNAPQADLKQQALTMLFISSLTIVIVTVISIIQQKKLTKNSKITLFLLIVVPALVSTFYVAWGTIVVNQMSVTKGPVHWHADFEVWNCGKKLDLLDPSGLSNRIGTPVLHEHGDDRIHVEGVVNRYQDVSLPGFFTAIGGQLSDQELRYPTNQGIITAAKGDLCQDTPGKVQIFLYRVDPDNPNLFTQQKLSNIEDYVMAPSSPVPPGDCLIIEFDQIKEKTDKLCESYRVAQSQGDLHGR